MLGKSFRKSYYQDVPNEALEVSLEKTLNPSLLPMAGEHLVMELPCKVVHECLFEGVNKKVKIKSFLEPSFGYKKE